TFVDERTIEIRLDGGGTRRIRGRDVVINTGTTPAMPPIDGLADAGVWDTESILALEILPESLIVLGGGYVGCEFASMFAIFGSRVTLIEGDDQVLSREDPDIATEVADLLQGQGVEVRLGSFVHTVRRETSGQVVVTLADGSQIRAEQMLVATGRTPVTSELGLDAAGADLT